MKKGYIFYKINVSKKDIFNEYPGLSEKIVSKFGGKYLFRGGNFDVIEGLWQGERNVLVEFKSFRQAEEFYYSNEYQEASKIRKNSAITDGIIIEGY